MNSLTYASCVLVILAALTLYLACAHQKLVSSPLPRRLLLIVGILLVIVAEFLLLQFFGSATSIFMLLTTLMLFWTLSPIAFAYFHSQRKKR